MRITNALRGGGLWLAATSSILSGLLYTKAHADLPNGTHQQCTGGRTAVSEAASVVAERPRP